MRFKLDGTPPGNYLSFQVADEKVTGIEVIQGGAPVIVLERKSP